MRPDDAHDLPGEPELRLALEQRREDLLRLVVLAIADQETREVKVSAGVEQVLSRLARRSMAIAVGTATPPGSLPTAIDMLLSS